jgi:hypothetical protein
VRRASTDYAQKGNDHATALPIFTCRIGRYATDIKDADQGCKMNWLRKAPKSQSLMIPKFGAEQLRLLRVRQTHVREFGL